MSWRLFRVVQLKSQLSSAGGKRAQQNELAILIQNQAKLITSLLQSSTPLSSVP